jgi:hypothetical protein
MKADRRQALLHFFEAQLGKWHALCGVLAPLDADVLLAIGPDLTYVEYSTCTLL